jgi:hypothetical protein
MRSPEYPAPAPMRMVLIAGIIASSGHARFELKPSRMHTCRAGKVKGPGVSSLQRSALASNLPNMVEEGLPDFEMIGWFAAFVPAKTPRPVIDKLNGPFKTAMADKSVEAALLTAGIEPVTSTPEELRAYVVSETRKWSKSSRPPASSRSEMRRVGKAKRAPAEAAGGCAESVVGPAERRTRWLCLLHEECYRVVACPNARCHFAASSARGTSWPRR